MTVAIEMGHTTAGTRLTWPLKNCWRLACWCRAIRAPANLTCCAGCWNRVPPGYSNAIIDPEGDFVALAERFGHLLIDAEDDTERGLQVAGERARAPSRFHGAQSRGARRENQMRRAAAFLGGLFDVARDHWYPMLVVVDEAQLFAPAVAGEVTDEARKLSLGAMTNLMCRGRKRGLAGIIATQRLAKLAKNVAAEASNFLMGRTFLDIDMARAADLLG